MNEKDFLEYKEKTRKVVIGANLLGEATASVVSSVGSGLYHWMNDTVSSLSTSIIPPGGTGMGMGKGMYPRNQTGISAHGQRGRMEDNIQEQENQNEITEMHEYLNTLEPLVLTLSKHAKALVRKDKETSNGIKELSTGLNTLGKYEQCMSLQDGLVKTSGHIDVLSTLAAEHAEKEVKYLEEALVEYLRFIQAARIALEKHQYVYQQYETTRTQVTAKEAHYDKRKREKGSEREKEKKMKKEALEAMEKDIDEGHQKLEEHKIEYEIVSGRILYEMRLFKANKSRAFRLLLSDFIQVHIDYHTKVEQEWLRIIPELENTELKESSSGSDANGLNGPNAGNREEPYQRKN